MKRFIVLLALAISVSAFAALNTGDVAPDFTLPTQKGELQSLSQLLAKGAVLLAFHRGTW